MNSFNILTIIISVIIFLGLFIYTFYIYYNNNPTIFPKDMTACPDFWTINPDGTCQIPLPISGKTALNIGNLADSQKRTYSIYTYRTIEPDLLGNELDTLLDISNISYLSEYNDPITRYDSDGNSITTSIKTGIVSGSTYRYDNSNNIPYGYSIRNPNAIDFNDPGWASYGDPYCAIQSWVKQNNIAWDGILAYNKC